METKRSKMKPPFCGNIAGNLQLPCGKFENRPIRRVPLYYLLWWTTKGNLRDRYPTTTTAVLHHITWRIQQKGGVAELLGEDGEDKAANLLVPGWDMS
jgi:uncharacterized protein (DUF3820 family)